MAAKKKMEMPVSEFLKDHTLEEGAALVEEELPVIPLKVVKPKVKPGEADYDWQAEYPNEEVFVFTSADGLTIGMTKLSPARKPKPGKLRTLHREGGMSVMWYFIELVSTATSLKLQEELEEEEYTRMLREWAEFAGIELSE
jgi:hypothetical protein